MNAKTIVILIIVAALSFGAYKWYGNSKADSEGKPIYRTANVELGTVVSSITATGVLKAYNIVEVKSKAGGIIQELKVDVGSVVEKGDLLARIDPSDTLASYTQAKADLDSADARIVQAQQNLELQKRQSVEAIKQAEASLTASKARLEQAKQRAQTQPKVSDAQLESAKASLETATKNLEQLQKVTLPQTRAQVKANYDAAKTQLDVAQRNYERLKSLLEKGYVSQQQVDNARNQLETARSNFITAEERQRTVEEDLSAQLATSQARKKEAEAALLSAQANLSQIQIVQQSLREAEAQYEQAQSALEQARANAIQIKVREKDLVTAQAQRTRSEAQVDNAKVQLDSTTIVAPRSGVVIAKFVEEGTIIPPGTSVFSQGTTLLQIADTERMFVEVSVDEADIAAVEDEQKVDITIDAYPNELFEGQVSRIDPQAVLEQNVTVVKVRVEVLDPDARLKPGMNATCEFIVKRKEGVLCVPNEAVKESEQGQYVEILVNGEPKQKPVQTGISGNDRTEILEGLQEGEAVVTSVEYPQPEESSGSGGSSQPGGGRTSPFGSPFGPPRR